MQQLLQCFVCIIFWGQLIKPQLNTYLTSVCLYTKTILGQLQKQFEFSYGYLYLFYDTRYQKGNYKWRLDRWIWGFFVLKSFSQNRTEHKICFKLCLFIVNDKKRITMLAWWANLTPFMPNHALFHQFKLHFVVAWSKGY